MLLMMISLILGGLMSQTPNCHYFRIFFTSHTLYPHILTLIIAFCTLNFHMYKLISADVQLQHRVLLTSHYPKVGVWLAQRFAVVVMADLQHPSPPWSLKPLCYIRLAPAGKSCRQAATCVIQVVKCTWGGPWPRPLLQYLDRIRV